MASTTKPQVWRGAGGEAIQAQISSAHFISERGGGGSNCYLELSALEEQEMVPGY